MKLGGKEFDFYWKIVKIPIFVIIGWSILALIIGLISFNLYKNIFSPIAGIVLGVLVFGFVGWTTVKDHKGDIAHAFLAGAVAGAITGLISGILSAIMLNVIPQIANEAIQQAVARGSPRDAAEKMIQIGSYAGIAVGPIYNAVIGTIVAGIAGVIAKKVK